MMSAISACVRSRFTFPGLPITSDFGGALVWSPHLPKRTALQEGARRGVHLAELHGRAARELGKEFAELASRIKPGGGRA